MRSLWRFDWYWASTGFRNGLGLGGDVEEQFEIAGTVKGDETTGVVTGGGFKRRRLELFP